jgi:hypothetical protein
MCKSGHNTLQHSFTGEGSQVRVAVTSGRTSMVTIFEGADGQMPFVNQALKEADSLRIFVL